MIESGADECMCAFADVAIESFWLGISGWAACDVARLVARDSPSLRELRVEPTVIDLLIAEKDAWDICIDPAPFGW